jgi:hypothetical protein
MEGQILKYEELPDLRKELREIIGEMGVTTESQNRMPVFEVTLKAREGIRAFENKHGKIIVEGRLSQAHKNLLETILWKKEVCKPIKDEEGREYLKVVYEQEKIRRYLSQGSKYSHKRYKMLLDDMMKTVITIKTKKIEVKGTLIMRIEKSKVIKPVKSRSPIIPKEVTLTSIIFGDVATALFENELRFTYDPKRIMTLRNGISQAIVRYLKTHQGHPKAGYRLKQLIEILVGEMENKRWWKIREYLKEDAKMLEDLGVVINFKEDRVFVIKEKFTL